MKNAYNKGQLTIQDIIFCAQEFYNKGQYSHCIDMCIEALKQQPNSSIAWELAGSSFLALGHTKKAKEYLQQAYELSPNNHALALNLAESYRRNNETQQSLQILLPLKNKLLKKVLNISLDELLSKNIHKASNTNLSYLQSTLLFNLAKAYSDIGDIKNATANYCTLLSLNANDYEAWYNLGNILLRNSEAKNALKCYENAILFVGKNQNFLQYTLLPQIAITQTMLDNTHAALEIYSQLTHNNTQSDFWFNYANALSFAQKTQESMQCYEKAIEFAKTSQQQSQACLNYALLLLRNGEFIKGFTLYESRLAFIESTKLTPDFPKDFPPINETLFTNKTLFIYCEQGFGDTLMFSRFLFPLSEFAQKNTLKLLFLPQAELTKVWKLLPHLELLDSTTNKHYDYAIPIGSIPLFLLQIGFYGNLQEESTFKNFTNALQTLRTPLVDYSSNATDSQHFNIGFAWKTNPNFKAAEQKSFSQNQLLNSLKPILETHKNIQLHSFQKEGLELLPKDFTTSKKETKKIYINDLGSSFNNFLDTLKALHCMQLLITPDTALAHLALNLNIPCLLLLNKRFSWCYGDFNQAKSLWYPNVNPIIQKKLGSWNEVFLQLPKTLKQLLEDSLIK